MRVSDSAARLDTVGRTSFRQAYSLTNLATRFASSPVASQRLAGRGAESAVSGKTGIHLAPPRALGRIDDRASFQDSARTAHTNSSESLQAEEYPDSTEETESESIQERPVRARQKSM